MADLSKSDTTSGSIPSQVAAPVELVLDTRQCCEVALYMYQEWERAMQPPLYVYRTFPDWLEQVITAAKKSPDTTKESEENATV